MTKPPQGDSQRRQGQPGSASAKPVNDSAEPELRHNIRAPIANLDTGRTAVRPGDQLGRYIVLEKVGQGGLGIVYAAYDTRLDRKVALKMVHARGFEANLRSKERLLREAKAIAKLNHPNIVTVHDVGIVGDEVFMAMEFVEGTTLKQWLASEQRSWRQVLDVFIEAGRGLAAAHQAGFIHRDFKPENVLIHTDGRVRVLDFSLVAAIDSDKLLLSQRTLDNRDSSAKGDRTSSSSRGIMTSGNWDHANQLQLSLTKTGVILGTPLYMAPEQHLGQEIDARADQFSFCVSLYEALYGTLPFRGSPEHLGRNKLNQRIPEPPPDTRVPVWIRNLLLRGLSPTADQRWPSMKELLAALSKDPWSQRKKWLSAAVIVVVVAGASAVTWSLSSSNPAAATALCRNTEARLAGIWDREQKTELRQAVLMSQTPYAESTWKWLENRLTTYTDQWVSMYQTACEATQVRGQQASELLARRLLCLDHRLMEVAALAGILRDQAPLAVQTLPQAFDQLRSLDDCANAEVLLTDVEPPLDAQTAAAVDKLRQTLAQIEAQERAGRSQQALVNATAVVEVTRGLGYAPILAEALYRRGQQQTVLGTHQPAEASLLEAYWLAQGAKYDRLAASIATALVASVGYHQNRHREGLLWGQHADVALVRAGIDGAARAALHHHMGLVHYRLGDYENALMYAQQSLTAFLHLGTAGELQAAKTLNFMGALYRAQGQYDIALASHQRGLDIVRAALGDMHPRLARFLNNIASVYMSQKDYQRAIETFRHALAIYEAAGRELDPGVAAITDNMGNAYGYLGNYDQSIAYHERALHIYEQVHGGDHLDVAYCLLNLGIVLGKQGKYTDAVAVHKRALSIMETIYEVHSPELIEVLHALGHDYVGLSAYDQAIAIIERAVDLAETKQRGTRLLAQGYFMLAHAHWEGRRDRARALRLAEKARGLHEAAGDPANDIPAIDAWLNKRRPPAPR